MLTVQLLCVGKLKEEFYQKACEEYRKRLQGYCKIELYEIAEQRLPDGPSPQQVQRALAREAVEIESRLSAGTRVVALCVEGRQMSSEEWSQRLGRWMVEGVSRVALVIGGSFGLDESVKRRAHLRLSLSEMTFPHHLARVMAMEQLYRALNLAAGGKYHK